MTIKDKQVIFLLSQPRAGSTLLQAMLGSHPDIHTCSEPWIALPHLYALKEEGVEYEYNKRWSQTAINAFFNESGIDQKIYRSSLNIFLSSLYQKALDKSGKKLFLDKTPRYYEIATELKEIFPEAKFIVLYRHPLAVLNSIIKTWVNNDTEKLFYHARDLLAAPHKLTEFAARNKGSFCLVRYEDLVRSPKTELGYICEYLEVGYREEMINYRSDVNWFYGDKNFKEKQAPDDQSIDVWKKQLSEKRNVNFCFYYLRELGEDILTQLGYDYASAYQEIGKFKPNEADFRAWQTLMSGKYIVSAEELKEKARSYLYESSFKAWLRKLVS